jgi:methionyl-tRNA formyltransferase
MNQQKIILLCSTRLAFPSIQLMLFLKNLGVVVIPEYAEEMIENTVLLLKDSGVPVVIVNRKNYLKKLTELIKKIEIDLGVVISFGYKLPESIFSLPRFGFYNIHPGPLPAYRGPDPVFRQILNREKQAGVSIHEVDKDYDTGKVVMTEMIRLDPMDTHGILTERLALLSSKLLSTFLKLFSLTENIPSRSQDETRACYYKKQALDEIIINWKSMQAEYIIALINACNPWNKGAITKLNNKIVRIVEAVRETNQQEVDQLPGQILTINERGVRIGAIGNEIICARIIYIDEGFLPAQRLAQFGIIPGMQFSKISGIA